MLSSVGPISPYAAQCWADLGALWVHVGKRWPTLGVVLEPRWPMLGLYWSNLTYVRPVLAGAEGHLGLGWAIWLMLCAIWSEKLGFRKVGGDVLGPRSSLLRLWWVLYDYFWA